MSKRIRPARLGSWDGVIRQHVVLYAMIEWGDPSAYGTRTRCKLCGTSGLLLARKTMYVDRARIESLRKQVVPFSADDNEKSDRFERAVTEEQCRGITYRGAPEPICTGCGTELVYRYLSGGKRGSNGATTAIPANGWTALLLHAEPGPQGCWQWCVATGGGPPDPTALVRRMAARAYVDRPSLFAQGEIGEGTLVPLVGDESAPDW